MGLPSEVALSIDRHRLEEFVNNMHALITDWEMTRARLHELEKSVENWKQMAGKLNDQLNKS